MRLKPVGLRRCAVATVLAGSVGVALAATGFVTLSSSGKTVLTKCGTSKCTVDSLPGEANFDLVASRSSPIVKNGVTIGTLYDKVWRNCIDQKSYIFGTRVSMNANQWDETGIAFDVNDIIRQTRADVAVAVASNLGSPAATKPMQLAGRAFEGLNEYDGSQPDRNNGWVNFRVDASAADTSGGSSPNSPWVLAKMKAPEGYNVQSFSIRVLNSDLPDPTNATDIYLAGYQPICTTDACQGPPIGGDDD